MTFPRFALIFLLSDFFNGKNIYGEHYKNIWDHITILKTQYSLKNITHSGMIQKHI